LVVLGKGPGRERYKMSERDEQAERIKENLALFDPEEDSFFDWEEIFEDRDPFEFL
jgi:hypothetical protein